MILTFIKNAAAFAQNGIKRKICGRGKRMRYPVTPAVFGKGGVYGNGCSSWRYGRLCVFCLLYTSELPTIYSV